MINKITLNKYDYNRIILTDLLPYEVPIIFNNEGFYNLLNENVNIPRYIKEDVLKLNNNFDLKKLNYTKPFNFKIAKNNTSYRTLSIMHPTLQNQFIKFYKKYDQVIINACNKSPFSLRKVIDIDTAYYEKEDENEKIKYANYYFKYKKFKFMYKFYNSYEFNNLEKKYSNMMTLDISKCFYNIYTHSVTWAVKNKEYAKNNTGKRTFENDFDSLMQKSNYNETNGIIVGPEISRIFAEIIFQDIDVYVYNKLATKYQYKIDYEIRRYVDDYFIFSNDINLLEEINSLYQTKLEEYKLYINREKTRHIKPPFITNISMAKIDLGRIIESVFSEYIIVDKDVKEIKIKEMKDYYRKSLNSIAEIKKIIKLNELSYEELSSFICSVFKKKFKKLFNGEYTIRNEENLESFLLYSLDILYFVYSMSIKVNVTYTISNIIVLINNIITSLSKSSMYNIQKKIYDESIAILKKVKEINISVLNLLIVLGSFDNIFDIPKSKLYKILNIDIDLLIDLDYFQIVSLIYFIKDKSDYSELKNKIIEIIKNKLDVIKPFIDTEVTLLFLDTLSCPYFTKKQKRYICSQIINPSSSLMNEIIKFNETKQWFINWSNEISIETLLQKKELKHGYD